MKTWWTRRDLLRLCSWTMTTFCLDWTNKRVWLSRWRQSIRRWQKYWTKDLRKLSNAIETWKQRKVTCSFFSKQKSTRISIVPSSWIRRKSWCSRSISWLPVPNNSHCPLRALHWRNPLQMRLPIKSHSSARRVKIKVFLEIRIVCWRNLECQVPPLNSKNQNTNKTTNWPSSKSISQRRHPHPSIRLNSKFKEHKQPKMRGHSLKSWKTWRKNWLAKSKRWWNWKVKISVWWIETETCSRKGRKVVWKSSDLIL